MNLLTGGFWVGAHDADPRVIALYERHYSADPQKKGHHHVGIAGPSERMVLLTTDAKALWVWRLILSPEQRISKLARPDMRRKRKGLAVGEKSSSYFGDESGIMCSVFRNEGPILSSLLVAEATGLAWRRWPGQRLFTYVWPAKVKSVNPGYCSKAAGWQLCGRNKYGRLIILEKPPRKLAETGAIPPSILSADVL